MLINYFLVKKFKKKLNKLTKFYTTHLFLIILKV